MPDPRILVTNDDGIEAPGIEALEEIAHRISDDVWTIAPDLNNSGAAHSLTLRRPLRYRHRGEQRFSVDGTPTDCVLLGLQHLIPGKPVDLVLSGVNHGSNIGEDVTYSGTIAAAMEATLFKTRAIAFSQVWRRQEEIDWSLALAHAPDLISRLTAMPWPDDVLININFPDCAASEVKGVKVAEQGKRKLGDELIERLDPRGVPYVWIGLQREDDAWRDGTDIAAVNEGWISVTPIHLNMTHYPSLQVVEKALRG
ncbi:5'-nucleotidase /3'-nucleotidase /exopolyphosphatase [Arboricoccus pini]|uniref:5'-nucleotidase SurE n=1 Tax=Arboricoccus pini TaxID=1963835 RepID=A0A212QQ15_9PROT|nr:5'/3'-nucleotidase SurE [Arboricoccus pini]SNB61522.1 5'-nucleotidase /3'-nucleotidase /exopolyphosphatase [Arboricoccus pini]